MTELDKQLTEIIKQWRQAAQGTRHEALGIVNLRAQGHLYGMSDGLELAADQIEKLLRLQKNRYLSDIFIFKSVSLRTSIDPWASSLARK